MAETRTYKESIKRAFENRQSVIIGLTGKTGSGCTEVSKILQKETFQSLNLSTPKDHDFNNASERKYSVIYNYMSCNNRWQPFMVISASSIIYSFILEKGIDYFSQFIDSIKDRIPGGIDLTRELEEKFRPQFLAYNSFIKEHTAQDDFWQGIQHFESQAEDYHAIKEFILKKLPDMRDEFRAGLDNYVINFGDSGNNNSKPHKSALYVYIMQTIGNNIRSSGQPYDSKQGEESFYKVAKRIDNCIQFLQLDKNGVSRICIDAIRNSYEAFYFKDKYSTFYLVSVNTDESERKRRLNMFDQAELDSLDQTEEANDGSSINKLFYHQNMKECLAISDIHLYNPRQETVVKNEFLTEQLVKYLCLMIHPGLITPSAIERCMQSAYVAKLNSGCLSRQVGAVITDQDFSIKAIGWNDVPSGQVPCNLRCAKDCLTNCDRETFSDFERQNKAFFDTLSSVQQEVEDNLSSSGLGYAYCFKDVYNAISGGKNQVYTRALHAEENAFLQISKYGGSGIKGGKLFSTASPCELCSKKAFQLGIREIYYIDPYPGISESHILNFGTKFRPSLNLYYGAIGNAYVDLYTPRIPLKDELELLTGIKPKSIVDEKKESN